MTDTMRLPSNEWVEKYSWRLGVYITLWLTGFLAVAAAEEQLAKSPKVATIIGHWFDLGMLLMTFSFMLAVVLWAEERYHNWRGESNA